MNRGVRLIKPDQRIELIKSNQELGLMNPNQDIKSQNMARFSIMEYGKISNHDRQDTQ